MSLSCFALVQPRQTRLDMTETCLYICVVALCPIHQFFSHLGTISFLLRPEFFYFLFYRFFQPDVRVGGRKKNKNKIQGRLKNFHTYQM